MMNAFATAISIGLQYGVPLETFVKKFSYMRFDPEGMTTNPEIPFAKSLPDYIMRWLASRFLDPDVHEELGILSPEVRAKKMAEEAGVPPDTNGGNGHGNGGTNGDRTAGRTVTQRRCQAARGGGEAGRRGADGHAAGGPGEAAGARPRSGVLAVRRHDAAHGQLLHVHELRQQHRLRVAAAGHR